MIEPPSPAERFEALERRAAHHERTIEELDKSVTEAWHEIGLLKRQVARLEERLAEAEAALPASPDRRPPHY